MLARWQSRADFVVHRGAIGFGESRKRRVGFPQPENIHAATCKDT